MKKSNIKYQISNIFYSRLLRNPALAGFLFLIFGIVILPTTLADAPFIPNIRAADGGVTINEGESCLAIFGDSVYVICNINERSSVAMIPFGRSFNEGDSWQPTIQFSDPTVGITWHTDPVLLTDDQGNLHMLIQYSTTVLKHYLSTDGGNTWADTSDISDRGTGGSVDKPWMVYRQGKLYCAWQEFGGSSNGIRFAKSTDNGATWTRSLVDTRTGILALTISSSGILYLGYVSGSSLYFTKSTNDGASWTTPTNISDVSYSSGYGDRAPLPSIAVVDDTVLLLIWVDSRSGNWDILGLRSSNGGATWGSRFTLNDSTAGGQCKGWVTTDPYGNFHIFYYHTPSWPTSSSSRWSIRYTNSTDGGITFRPSMRITDTTFTSPVSFLGDYHTIVTDSFNVYAVWADGRDGNNNLYFSRAPIGSLVGIEEISQKELLHKDFISVLSPSIAQNNFLLTVILTPLKRGENPKSERIKIQGYDITGRLLMRIFDGELSEGEHRIPVTITKGVSGILFLEFTVANQRIRKKIIVSP